MKFNFVRIKNFRNIDSLRISFNKGLNFFIGENGHGKTNLLETLYLSINGGSFRPVTTVNFVGANEIKKTFIETVIEKKQLESTIETKIENNRKNHFLNKKKASGSYLVKNFPCVLFSPDSLTAIKSGPEERRTLIDELLIIHNPENASLVSQFRKCLRSRNKILKNFVKGELEKKQTLLILESLEASFLEVSTKLTLRRIEALNDIIEDLNKAVAYISGHKDQKITIAYMISDENSLNKSAEEIQESLANRSRQLLDIELACGNSLIGPHKHDIQFIFNGNDSRYYCSQGQQRSLILAFKLAQIIYHYKIHGDYPVLMLDDVLSELDLKKRKRLVTFLKNLKAQIFVTTTDISSVDMLLTDASSVFTIENGKIRAE